jgi:hypothetical protein
MFFPWPTRYAALAILNFGRFCEKKNCFEEELINKKKRRLPSLPDHMLLKIYILKIFLQ